MGWSLIYEPPGQPAQYLRSLIFSTEHADVTESADAALVYFHRRKAASTVREHFASANSKHWRVVPVFVEH